MRTLIFFLFFFFFLNEQYPYLKAEEPGEDVEVYDPFAAPKEKTEEEQKAAETMELNFNNADLRSIIREISEFTKKHIVFPDGLSGKASLYSPQPLKRDEVLEALVSLLSVKGWTIDKSNPVIWKIIKSEEVKKTSEIDKDGKYLNSDLYITSFIPIKYINAEQIFETLKETVDNMRVYKDTNTLIVTDTKSKVNRFKELIAKLDKEGFEEKVDFIRLKVAIADDIAKKLTDILDIGGGGAKKDAKFPFSSTGGEPTEFKGRKIISKLIPDPRTNSIIVKGNDGGIEDVRRLIKELDTELTDEKQETRVFVYQLEHAEAETLANILQGVIKGITSEKKSIFAKEEESLTLGGKNLNVTADKKTNSLVIAGTDAGYQSILPIIKKLDLKRKQVQIEATIMEVTLNDKLGYGAAGAGGFKKGDNTFIGATQFDQFSSAQAFGSGFKDAQGKEIAGSQMLANLTGMILGFATKPLNLAGLNIPAFSALLKANKLVSESKILSKPSITVVNNEKAEFQVGKTIWIEEGTFTATAGGQNKNYKPQEVNLILKIEPKINAKDYVTMHIEQEIRDVGEKSNEDIPNRDILTRKADTMASAKSGETLIISGLIQDKVTSSVSKVPLLGDIPLLGYLFKTKLRTKEKTNILIFIQPTVLNTSEDIAQNASKWAERRKAFNKENGVEEDDWIGTSEHNVHPGGIVIEKPQKKAKKTQGESILEDEQKDDGIVDIEFNKDKQNGIEIK